MAPEVLLQRHYKKPADVYSFALTIFETMKWGEAYDMKKGEFKFPWKIAVFVMNGKRIEKPTNMREDIYELITKSWQQDPRERLTIEQIITRLKSLE